MRLLRSKRGLAVIAALLLILFLWRPGVYRLRSRISTSIGNALSRTVTIDNVRFHLLPRPGFDLEGLVIYDDPDFSPEPMIRSDEVSAAIRLRSLLRGRIEIATLSANEPSINLVRNNRGRWNLASLLERNAQIPAAPTAKPSYERRPAFPYLEATGARVNFKLGQTKKSYALMNADVALWQDSENSWGARIKAEPVRTDFHLTDTGILQINATWQRASNLRLTPLQISVRWQKGQLGQITQLLSGKDRGWRGTTNLTAQLSGTPEELRIEGQTAIDDFRRYDIVDTENVRLATACSGQYHSSTGTFAGLLCESPIGDGTVRLRGSATPLAQPPAYDLTLAAQNLPLNSLARLLRQAKKQVPVDLIASGVLNADFHAIHNESPVRKGAQPSFLTQWSGSGTATNVHLSANAGKDQVTLGTIPLTAVPAAFHEISRPGNSARRKPPEPSKELEPAEPHLRIGPVALAINGSAPVNTGGWISSKAYRFFLRGDTELKDLFRLEDVLGLPLTQPVAEGSAKLDVSVAGPWQGFAPPATLGSAQIRNVRAEMHGFNAPIELTSATISLTPDLFAMQKISARIGNSRWSGEVSAPRHCAPPGCLFQFDLATDQLSTADLGEWLTPFPTKRPWYRILNSASNSGSNSNSNDSGQSSPLLALQARGNLHVGRFELKKLVATQVTTAVEVDRGKITLSALRAQLLQGTHQGKWVVDASGRDVSPEGNRTPDALPPLRFHGTGTLQNISLEQLGALMNNAWITGTIDGSFDLDGSAGNFHDLIARSDGKLQFVMHNGTFPHVDLPGSPAPLPVHRFSGNLHLRKGIWDLSAGRMETRDGFYQLSGTASPGSVLDFVLTRSDEQSWALTGTLAKPRIAPLDPAEAKRSNTNTPSFSP